MHDLDTVVRALEGADVLDADSVQRTARDTAADVLGIGEGERDWWRVVELARMAECAYQEDQT